jgi:hypothetical protein
MATHSQGDLEAQEHKGPSPTRLRGLDTQRFAGVSRPLRRRAAAKTYRKRGAGRQRIEVAREAGRLRTPRSGVTCPYVGEPFPSCARSARAGTERLPPRLEPRRAQMAWVKIGASLPKRHPWCAPRPRPSGRELTGGAERPAESMLLRRRRSFALCRICALLCTQ